MGRKKELGLDKNGVQKKRLSCRCWRTDGVKPGG